MNNLKRILSLALATVMVLGMMVVGASAADFTDNADITHDAAADVMNALGIITGYEDGSFRPNGDVTRAEMAKMLSVALNGGKDPNVGLPTTLPYSDVKAKDWFAEYVMYCSNLNIIGGRGNGTFDPYGNVTAAEAAKMILVALGFDPEIFELVGANWSTNTMRLATTLLVGEKVETAKPLSLFSGIASISANTPLTRDQAAQLIYNGIQANTVKMALTGVTGSGVVGGIIGDTTNAKPTYEWSLTGPNLLSSKFNADIVEGVLTSVGYNKGTWSYSLAVTSYNSTKKDYEINSEAYTSSKDVSDYFMQNVRVIYRNERGARKNVLAITSASDDVLDACAWGDLATNTAGTTLNGNNLGITADSKFTANEVTYTADNLPVYEFLTDGFVYGAGTPADKDGTPKTLNHGYNVYDQAKLIDNDGDGRVDCVVVTPVTVSQVTSIRPTYILIRNLSANVTLKDHNVAEGLAVNDFVTYTQNPLTKVYTVEKAETVTGVMNASMDKDNTYRDYDQVQVGGTWYTVVENYTNLKKLVSSEVELILASGYVVNGKALTGAAVASDAMMLIAQAKETTTSGIYVDTQKTYLEVKVLKKDGTTENLKATGVVDGKTWTGAGAAPAANTITASAIAAATDTVSAGDNGLTGDNKVSHQANAGKVTDGTLYTYTTDNAAPGCVILTPYAPGAAGKDGDKYDDSMATFTVNNGLASTVDKSFRIDNNATVFVRATGGAYPVNAVVKGSDLSKWYIQNGYTAQSGSVLYADKASNGFFYVQEGAIILNEKTIPGATGQAVYYGYVTADGYYTTSADGKTPYIAVPLWNGTDNVTVLAKTLEKTPENESDPLTTANQKDETLFTAGVLVSYIDNGDGTATAMQVLTRTNDAVVAWDDAKVVKFQNEQKGVELDIDDKTVIIYVDGTKYAGVADGNIVLADPVDPYDALSPYYSNVYYVATSEVAAAGANDHVDVLILDVNNKIGSAMTSKPVSSFTLAEGKDANGTVKSWADGAYVITAKGGDFASLISDLDDNGTNLIFKFVTPADEEGDDGIKWATEGTTILTLTGPGGVKYVEMQGPKAKIGENAATGDQLNAFAAGPHFFVVNAKNPGPAGTLTNAAASGNKLPNGTYTVKIQVFTGNSLEDQAATNKVTTLLNQTFTVNF